MTANFCGFFFFLLQNSGLLVLPWGLKPLVYIYLFIYLFIQWKGCWSVTCLDGCKFFAF